MTSEALPELSDIQSSPSSQQSPLALALEILFEPSPILTATLEPQVHAVLKASSVESHTQLIDIALSEIRTWSPDAQAKFISGHPRIGESKHLSKLSASEQGAQNVQPTPPNVLARLGHLNVLYEWRYPGLRYITFVNGRSRAVIAEEMEDVLGIPHSVYPNEPGQDNIYPVLTTSKAWADELDRAVYDVGRIAKSRLGALGVS